MPSALAEVGSITLRAEHDLFASEAGTDAVADGLFEGLSDYLGARELAGRIGLADEPVGTAPEPVPGEGPPFWPPAAPGGAIQLRITNTGTEAWPAGSRLLAGWEETAAPYLARAPEDLEALDTEIPALEPGESVVIPAELPPAPGGGRAVAWISLMIGDTSLADRGSPALQLSTEAP
jgi:hypothetical protein